MANSVYFTLKDEGVKKTDVIGLLMPNCMEYVAFWLGASKIVTESKFSIKGNMRNFIIFSSIFRS